MEAQSINLTYIKNGSVETSSFKHNDTILDLKKTFGGEQGHDDPKDVTLYHTIFPLADEKLVRDLAETQDGISFNFANSPVVGYCSSEESGPGIVWVKNNGKWIILSKNSEERFDFELSWLGCILTGGYGEVAILRSGYVFMY